MTKLLSICIPTYNRAPFLKELLGTLLKYITPDIKDEIEIIISDNASTDNTQEIVKSFQKQTDFIQYYKNEENVGPDRNFIKVVEHAQGEFSWLFGDDDSITKDSLRTLLDHIKTYKDIDIFAFNIIEANKKLKPKSQTTACINENNTKFDLTQNNEVIRYINSINNLSFLFGYMSCYIFRTKTWQNIKDYEKYYDSHWVQMYIAWSFRKTRINVLFIKKHLVVNRGGNCMIDNLYNFTKLTLIFMEGPIKLIQDIFENNLEIRKQILNFYKKYSPLNYKTNIRKAKYSQKTKEQYNRLLELLKTYNYDKEFIQEMEEAQHYNLFNKLKNLLKDLPLSTLRHPIRNFSYVIKPFYEE